jgi:hypothetical protein
MEPVHYWSVSPRNSRLGIWSDMLTRQSLVYPLLETPSTYPVRGHGTQAIWDQQIPQFVGQVVRIAGFIYAVVWYWRSTLGIGTSQSVHVQVKQRTKHALIDKNIYKLQQDTRNN